MKASIKKILAAATALTLCMAMSVTAFAKEINQDSASKTGDTKVEYNVGKMYTVTIPETVTIDGEDVEVKADKVKVDYGEKLVVSLTGTSGTDNAFTVTSNGAVLPYEVTKDGQTINLNDEVLSVDPATATDNNGASGSAMLSFDLPAGTNVLYSGSYTGTVTFTVGLK